MRARSSRRRTIARLRAQGVDVDAEPHAIQIGRSVSVRDPFGNEHHLLDLDRELEGPRLFNVGISVPELDEAMRFLVFRTGDLDAAVRAVRALRAASVPVLDDTPRRAALGCFIAFRDPAGIAHELVELDPEPGR